MLVAVSCCECVYIYSSFWAPLFDRRILNYRVDAKFDPDAGKNNKEEFEKNYGYRGQNLIADLGNGKGPRKLTEEVGCYNTYTVTQSIIQ